MTTGGSRSRRTSRLTRASRIWFDRRLRPSTWSSPRWSGRLRHPSRAGRCSRRRWTPCSSPPYATARGRRSPSRTAGAPVDPPILQGLLQARPGPPKAGGLRQLDEAPGTPVGQEGIGQVEERVSSTGEATVLDKVNHRLAAGGQDLINASAPRPPVCPDTCHQPRSDAAFSLRHRAERTEVVPQPDQQATLR